MGLPTDIFISLNLVVLRTATVYGPYNLSGIVTPRITLGRVYKHLNEEMKYLCASFFTPIQCNSLTR